jgi:hypothetical protein
MLTLFHVFADDLSTCTQPILYSFVQHVFFLSLYGKSALGRHNSALASSIYPEILWVLVVAPVARA